MRRTVSGQLYRNDNKGGSVVDLSYKAFNLNEESFEAFMKGVEWSITNRTLCNTVKEFEKRGDTCEVIRYRLVNSKHVVAELNIYSKEEY